MTRKHQSLFWLIAILAAIGLGARFALRPPVAPGGAVLDLRLDCPGHNGFRFTATRQADGTLHYAAAERANPPATAAASLEGTMPQPEWDALTSYRRAEMGTNAVGSMARSGQPTLTVCEGDVSLLMDKAPTVKRSWIQLERQLDPPREVVLKQAR